jgi:hypothetical protein
MQIRRWVEGGAVEEEAEATVEGECEEADG